MKGRGIAIVGAGCVLPGALDPDELWELVVAGRSGLTRATSEAWGVPPESVLGSTALPALDRAHTDIGGYVLGFDERFDPTKYGLSRQAAAELPRIDRWAAYAAGEALAGV